jgi:hypothetical protein
LIEVTISYEDENDSYSISSIGYVRGSGASVAESEPFNYNNPARYCSMQSTILMTRNPAAETRRNILPWTKFSPWVSTKKAEALELLGSACISVMWE